MKQSFLSFDRSQADTYRKIAKVLAFRSGDAFDFHKPWGHQKLREGSWVIVPLTKGRVTLDIYGCDAKAFVATYSPSADGEPHTFEKHAEVLAYLPGKPFAVRTILRDGHVETEPAIGGAEDWLVQNPDGEVYAIDNVTFRATYRKID